MSLLQRKISEARSLEEIAAARAIAVLSEDPQEAANENFFSTDPLTGYDAAQIALKLFEGNRLEEFAGFLKEKSLSPNIILQNGLTLLQNSLFKYPQDEARLECLLSLGANPNLFMRKIEEEGFGSSNHRATYHPLNFAFANCPQVTTPEICRILRQYGASADGLRNYFEVDPLTAVPDDVTKAKLRRELVAIAPNAELSKIVRKDVDLSVMQKHVANMEAQLAAAGFQVVTYAPPAQKKKAEVALSPNQIGEMIEGKGVYMGVWEPKDGKGKAIGKSFRVFASPTDLADANEKKVLVTYKEAVREVASRKNWHGFDGANVANDVALYKALADGSIEGKWFIPPRELVDGKDYGGNSVVYNDNLFANRGKGAFKGTFTTTDNSSDYAHWYWSSTDYRDDPDFAWSVRFSDGGAAWTPKVNPRLSCRPVRVEELTL